MSLKGINAYKKGSLKQEVSAADPHRLTLMLLQGALDRIAYAKGAMERKEFESKSEHITRVVSILVYLRDTLDFEAGGELSENLQALYNYVIELVNQAHIKNILDPLDEAYSLIEPIRDAWVQIPEEAKQEAYGLRQSEQVG